MSEFINIVVHIMFSIEEMAEINMFVICVCAYHMFIFVFKCIYLTNGYTSYMSGLLLLLQGIGQTKMFRNKSFCIIPSESMHRIRSYYSFLT